LWICFEKRAQEDYFMFKMNRLLLGMSGALMLASAAPALAGAGGFAFVNAVGSDISAVSIRRVGSAEWRALGVSAAAGKSASAAFSDPDCAFDIRATIAGGATVTWSGVNLCDVKLLTLRRNDAGLAWVDYD
jgi:hypothetical protein